MKTILLSGGDIDRSEQKDQFYRYLNKEATGQSVLIVAFARDKNDWPFILSRSQAQFSEYLSNPLVELASKDAEIFSKQVQAADIISIKGGSTGPLVAELRQLKFHEMELENKVVIGSSAGANALCSNYYSLADNVVKEGLSVVRENVVVHYKSSNYAEVNWHDAATSFDNNLPTIMIPEGQFLSIRLLQ